MKKFLLLLLVAASIACDAGKGSVSPVKVTAISQQQVNVPFDYRDCTSPATVSFSVVAQKTSTVFTVRVFDVITGVEYNLDSYRPASTTYVFPPLPAAGHFYYVELFNGTRGKITTDIYAK